MLATLALIAALPTLQTARDDTQLGRELCAIYALPERPGISDSGSAEAAERVTGLNMLDWKAVPTGSIALPVGCTPSMEIEMVRISPDRRFAASYGGWQDAPLAGGYGECYYEKTDGIWRTLACVITAIS